MAASKAGHCKFALTIMDIAFREMTVEDLPDVLANERESYSHPWSEDIFKECLRNGHECWVVESDKHIAAHGVLSIAVGECHLLNVCVAPPYQGAGLGRQLVEYLLEIATQQNAKSAFLEVRPSNIIAYKLYESIGFNEVGVRKDYYPANKGREDALVLAKELFRFNK